MPLALLTLAGLIGASLVHGLRLAGDSASDAHTRIAVLPFQVSGNPELAYLRAGFADLLSTKLDGAGELRTVDVNALLPALGRGSSLSLTPASGSEVAASFGARFFVLGTILDAKGRLHAKASLYDAHGILRGAVEATVGDERHVFELVDGVAHRLVAISPLQPRGRMARLGTVTTESFTALKEYLDGERLLRAGRPDSAIAAYGRAIEADSGFALAYYRMAVGQMQDPTPGGIPDAYARAVSLADRLPPRDRMLVEAFDALRRHQDLEAERLYREVLSLHPDEVEAWVFLGQVLTYYGLWRGRSIAEARAAFERALELDPSNFAALNDLSWLAAMEERFDEAAAHVERVLQLQPDGHRALGARMWLALHRRDRKAEALAVAELRGYESTYLNYAQRWAHFSGDLEARLRIARLLTEPALPVRWRRLGHVVSARYYLDRGRVRQAFDEQQRIEPIDRDAYLLTWARSHLRPFLPTATSELEHVAHTLEEWRPAGTRHALARLYLLGMIRIRLQEPEAAEHLARELEATAASLAERIRVMELEGGGPQPPLDEAAPLPPAFDSTAEQIGRDAELARALATGLRAWRAAEAKRFQEALEHLEHLNPERWWARAQTGGIGIDAVQSWLRAEVLVALGRDEEALHLYAPLGFLWGDAGLLAPKHFRMAEIYERLGNREKARWHYERFVELWEDCDPPLRTWVKTAAARAARL